MTRSDIIERLYELKSDESVPQDRVSKLVSDVFNRTITLQDAESELRLIDPYYTKVAFLSNLKGKPIYKNISEYRKGNLSNILIAKMMSSLVTQLLIWKEKNPDINLNQLQIDVLLRMIQDFADNPENIDHEALNHLLSSYGWSDDANDSSRE